MGGAGEGSSSAPSAISIPPRRAMDSGSRKTSLASQGMSWKRPEGS